MTALLVLAHGWGFDHSVWEPVRRALPGMDCLALDFGYLGAPDLPPLPEDRPLIAVGHSLGFCRLMAEPRRWRAAVSVNGFLRFTAAPDFPTGVASRVVDRMIARFAADPRSVFEEFMRRCGSPTPLPAGAVVDVLAEGLRWLRDADARPALTAGGPPILALAAPDDAIVPPAMTDAAFAGASVAWLDGGGHVLPLARPHECAQAIIAFLNGVP